MATKAMQVIITSNMLIGFPIAFGRPKIKVDTSNVSTIGKQPTAIKIPYQTLSSGGSDTTSVSNSTSPTEACSDFGGGGGAWSVMSGPLYGLLGHWGSACGSKMWTEAKKRNLSITETERDQPTSQTTLPRIGNQFLVAA